MYVCPFYILYVYRIPSGKLTSLWKINLLIPFLTAKSLNPPTHGPYPGHRGAAVSWCRCASNSFSTSMRTVTLQPEELGVSLDFSGRDGAQPPKQAKSSQKHRDNNDSTGEL